MATDRQVQLTEMLNKINEEDNKKVNSVDQLRHMMVMMIQLNVPLLVWVFFLKEIYIAEK